MIPEPEMYVEQKCIFSQEGDCCSSGEQELVIEKQNGGVDEKDDFWVIATERFAFDSIDDVVKILRRAGCREHTPEVAPKQVAEE